MNLFNRKSEPEPEQITGTEALRQRLKNYVCTRSLVSLAGDISDNLAQKSQRDAARSIASKISGDASDDVTASIARSFISNMASSAGRGENGVSATELEAFLNGKDDTLSPAIKSEMAVILYPNSPGVTFDAERDLLIDHNTVSTEPAPISPEPWRHPDARAQAAKDAYDAELVRYNASLSTPPPPRKRL